MIPVSSIIKYAEKYNKRIEIQQAQSTLPIGRKSKKTLPYMIGIEARKNIWYWWESFDNESIQDDFEVFFNHSYNTNTGNTCKKLIKGISKEIQIEMLLKK